MTSTRTGLRALTLFFSLAAVPGSLAWAHQHEPHAPPPPLAVQAQRMREAAAALLTALGEQSQQARFAFDNEQERRDWSNLPAPMHERHGVELGRMTPEQRRAVHALVRASSSSQGYLKVAGVIRIEDILLAMATKQRPDAARLFGSDKYYVAVFGDPGTTQPWGWQLDGHHLGFNVTVLGDRIVTTPMFFGAEPDVVPDGPEAGWQVFGAERAKGLLLARSLDAAQREKAVLAGQVPRDIFTGPGRGDALEKPEGIPATALSPEQRAMLWSLIAEYLHNAPPAVARAHREKIAADGDGALRFVWMGPIDDAANVYYRVQSPSVIIEYDNTGQNTRPANSNHVHLILRDPTNDFGEDLLARHYREAGHHRGR